MDVIQCIVILLVFNILGFSNCQTPKCEQEKNCKLPNCFCPTFNYPFFNASDIPQMVYFGFDDALTPLVDPVYKKLFRPDRMNPNGCPIAMTLYVSDQYTSYEEVKYFYDHGMEIASHSVKHGHVRTKADLYEEAKQQKQNLALKGKIPESDIIGWRSPFLETAGDYQPDVLQKLGYNYDISLTYKRGRMKDPNPWPFTADFGWPFRCQMKPCLSESHPGFWEFPVNSMIDFKDQFACNYADGCYNRPANEDEAYKYLMDNFNDAYEGNRAPLGINIHASWLLTNYNFKAMDRFINDILKLHDVFIIPVKSVLDWMKSPTRLSDIYSFAPWNCKNSGFYKTTKVMAQRSTDLNRVTPLATKRISPKSIDHFKITPKYSVTAKSTTRETKITRKQSTFIEKKSPTIRYTTIQSRHENSLAISTSQSYIKTGLPQVQNNFHPTTKQRQLTPATSSASTNKFNWSWILGGLFHKTSEPSIDLGANGISDKERCTQGLNCKLPECFCEGNRTPGGFEKQETPQFVYISFDGDFDTQVFLNYRRIFSGRRRNPNLCPISGTFFVSRKMSTNRYLSYLHEQGHEIALRGSSSSHITNISQLNLDLFSLGREMSIPVSGWRSPELKPLGDDQFSALVKQGLKYDSSLVLPTTSDKTWPFTLDFGWKDPCVIPDCPEGKYPGLWEVPNVPVTDYRNMYPCNYVDGCMFSPGSAEETFQFLWNNFKRFYTSNKSPFGINFRTVWFTHVAYRNNVRGFEMFLDKLGQTKDVYVVSTEKLIKWMKGPIPLSDMKFKFDC